MAAELRPPFPIGARSALVIAILIAFGWAVWFLELRISQAIPEAPHLRVLTRFFASCVQPDLSPEILAEVGRGFWNTIVFAVAAMAFALVIGWVLGFLAGGRTFDQGHSSYSTKIFAAMPWCPIPQYS